MFCKNWGWWRKNNAFFQADRPGHFGDLPCKIEARPDADDPRIRTLIENAPLEPLSPELVKRIEILTKSIAVDLDEAIDGDVDL